MPSSLPDRYPIVHLRLLTFQSSEKDLIPEYNLLVTTGRTSFEKYDSLATEIVSLNGKECPTTYQLDFHHRLSGERGAILHNDTLVLCGGTFKNNKTRTKFCFTLGSPEPVAKMLVKRRALAAIAVNNGTALFVTGGNNLTSTEFITIDPNRGAEFGPEMPRAMEGHCLVDFNATHLISMGGKQGSAYFNAQDKIWTVGPSMKLSSVSVCGLIVNEGEAMIVAIHRNDLFLQALHVSSDSDESEWQTIPVQGAKRRFAGGVPAPDQKSFYFFGTNGYCKEPETEPDRLREVFQLRCRIHPQKSCELVKTKARLSIGRCSGLGFIVPNKRYPCQDRMVKDDYSRLVICISI